MELIIFGSINERIEKCFLCNEFVFKFQKQFFDIFKQQLSNNLDHIEIEHFTNAETIDLILSKIQNDLPNKFCTAKIFINLKKIKVFVE